MTTGTTVTWDPLPSDTDIQAMNIQSATMASQGKTDNIPVKTWPNGEGNPPMVIVRQWTTPADAQEWLTFVGTYNPQSAVINS